MSQLLCYLCNCTLNNVSPTSSLPILASQLIGTVILMLVMLTMMSIFIMFVMAIRMAVMMVVTGSDAPSRWIDDRRIVLIIRSGYQVSVGPELELPRFSRSVSLTEDLDRVFNPACILYGDKSAFLPCILFWVRNILYTLFGDKISLFLFNFQPKT